jgi:hypothetical protein
MNGKIINKISPDEALIILKRLSEKDPDVARRIEKEAERLFKQIDVEGICGDVYSALEGIAVEDLWDRAGPSRYGYSSPEDMAVEMMEEELAPYNQEVIRFLESDMPEEARLYCMGVLKGIYKYAHESSSEFKDWVVDIPEGCFGSLLEDWKKRVKNKNDIAKMGKFIKKECGDWKVAL